MAGLPRELLASKGVFPANGSPSTNGADALKCATHTSSIKRMQNRGGRIVIETCREAPEEEETVANVWVRMVTPSPSRQKKGTKIIQRLVSPKLNTCCSLLCCVPSRLCSSAEEQYEYTMQYYCTPPLSRAQDAQSNNDTVNSNSAS